MSRRSGSANKTRGVAASSRDTGLTLFDMTTCEASAPTLPALTSSAAGSHAKTCLSLGKALASQASAAVCGSSSRASLAFFDRASSSWRTSQLSCLGGWTSFSETFPKRGMMRSGSISALPTSERRTDESGCSSSRGGEMWATAQAHDAKGSPGASAQTRGGFQASLPSQVRTWPTPMTVNRTSQKAQTGRTTSGPSRGGPSYGLEDVVRREGRAWPTPSAARAGNDLTLTCSGDGRETPNKLGWAVAMLSQGSAKPTPAARDFKDTGTSPSEFERNTPGLAARAGGSLNPDWVSQLMGFPAGWTSPLTDGPQGRARPKGHGKRRASRKTDTSGGNG